MYVQTYIAFLPNNVRHPSEDHIWYNSPSLISQNFIPNSSLAMFIKGIQLDQLYHIWY